MGLYFNISYEVLMPLNPDQTQSFVPKTIETIKKYMSPVVWPNEVEGSEGIKVKKTESGVSISLVLEANSRDAAEQVLMLCSLRIQDTINAPQDFGPHVGETLSVHQPHMPIRYIIQQRAQNDQDGDQLFVVYEAGAAYQIQGNTFIHELENPLNPFFSSDKYRRLSAEETQAIQNFEIKHGGPNYASIWEKNKQASGFQPGGEAEIFMRSNILSSKA
ncbi:MAG: hypothetical protein AB7F43_14645 [Bacteriovoracia bacterium]